MIRPSTLLSRWRPVLRAMPVQQLLLRAALASSGAGALLLGPGSRPYGPGTVLLVLGVLALASGLTQPDGPGPAILVGTAALGWVLHYGSTTPPLGTTLTLAALLYLYHAAAALAAALPPGARVEPALLARWGVGTGAVLASAAVVAGAVRLLGVRAGSAPLEYAGIAAAVVLAAIPVLLTRNR